MSECDECGQTIKHSYKVLVSGTRNRSFEIRKLVESELNKKLDENHDALFLILGDAVGVDDYAHKWALDNRVDHCVIYARWVKSGKRAGIFRNQKMFEEDPDEVLAFPAVNSKGTKHVINTAKKKNIKLKIFEV